MKLIASILLAFLFLIGISISQQMALDDYNEGKSLYLQEKLEQAVRSCDEAIKNNSQDASAWNEKGKALFELGKYSESVLALNGATNIDPSFTEAWFYKGHALDKIRAYGEASDAFDNVVYLELRNSSGKSLAVHSSFMIGYLKGRHDYEIFFEERIKKAAFFSIIPLIIALAILVAIWRSKNNLKLYWVSLFYVVLLILIIGSVSILLWDIPDPKIAYVPVPILEWAFIGAVVAVLYRLATRQKSDGLRFNLWIISKPIIGLSMGALVYFIALGGSILLGNPLKNDLPSITTYWLCALAFIGGFSDKFSMDLMDKFVSASIKAEDEDVNSKMEGDNENK